MTRRKRFFAVVSDLWYRNATMSEADSRDVPPKRRPVPADGPGRAARRAENARLLDFLLRWARTYPDDEADAEHEAEPLAATP